MQTTSGFTLAPGAEKFIRRMLRFSGVASPGFRLEVSAGGCSGYNANFSVEAAPQAGDATVDVGDIRLYLPAESRLLLEGVTVDFAETPTNSGFTFVNPNAAPCACSTSAPMPAGVSAVNIGTIRRA